MDCSQFADSLTPEAHGVLQYMTMKVNSKGHYAKGVSPIVAMGWFSASDAMAGISLLRDAEAISLYQEEPLVFGLDARCSCSTLLFKDVVHTPILIGEEDYPDGLSDKSSSQKPEAVKLSSEKTATGKKSLKRKKVKPTGWIQKDPEAWHAGDLAEYFASQLTVAVRRQRQPIAGQINDEALRGSFARWRNQGWDSPIIKEMIDAFCAAPEKWCRNGTPMWRAFISNSTRLHVRVIKGEARDHQPEAVVGMVARRRLARQGR